MEHMYMHLAKALTVPQLLRLGMLHLVRRPDRRGTPHKDLSSVHLCKKMHAMV